MIRRILKAFLYYKIEKYLTVSVRDAHQENSMENPCHLVWILMTFLYYNIEKFCHPDDRYNLSVKQVCIYKKNGRAHLRTHSPIMQTPKT